MTTANTTAKGWTPEEQIQIDADTMDDEVFADRLLEQLEAAPALLSKEQVYDMEEKIRGHQMRRVIFALASMSGNELCKAIKSDRDFAVTASGVACEMPDLKAKYLALIEVFELVNGRITVALALREDMLQVMEEGKSVVV